MTPATLEEYIEHRVAELIKVRELAADPIVRLEAANRLDEMHMLSAWNDVKAVATEDSFLADRGGREL